MSIIIFFVFVDLSTLFLFCRFRLPFNIVGRPPYPFLIFVAINLLHAIDFSKLAILSESAKGI